MAHSYEEFEYNVLADLYRITGRVSAKDFITKFAVVEGFRVSTLLRVCQATRDSQPLKSTVYPVARVLLRHYSHKYGISISPRTPIGPGLYVGHFGGITVSPHARIGSNCNLSQEVTIGVANRGTHAGYPVIGDDVYLGPGAKVFGGIDIGSGSAVGANCVVNREVPPGAVVVGVPGKVVSSAGSVGYVNNTDYDPVIQRSRAKAGRVRRMLLRGTRGRRSVDAATP